MKSKLLVVVLLVLMPWFAKAQQKVTFEGMDASQLPKPEFDVDPNGAIGTKQYLEWVNPYVQAFDKVTFLPLWSAPLPAGNIWLANGIQNCNIAGDGVVLFDRQASRWVIGGHNSTTIAGPYYYCIAVSNTDDLSSVSLAWYTYQFPLNTGVNSQGNPYFPDWPKLGSWADGYYLTFDLLDPNHAYLDIGVEACALDRTNILIDGTANPMQCFSDPNPIPVNGTAYLRHSLIPADVEGSTPPPSGRNEFFVSIQNPPLDGKTTTSTALNLWAFHVDWSNPTNSTFVNSPLNVKSFTPGCYNVAKPNYTICVPEPALNKQGHHYVIDSVGDRLMPRLAYRNFGTYESFLVSHDIRVGVAKSLQLAVRWYELRANGSGTPTVFQSGNVSPDIKLYRFMPSIAQDHVGNAAVGYTISSPTVHPGIRESSWSLPKKTKPVEVNLQHGSGDVEDSTLWGDYTSMTVDPVDDCTFWYVNEYLQANETGGAINWDTRIAKFSLPTCTGRK
jgi:hypothetical protein